MSTLDNAMLSNWVYSYTDEAAPPARLLRRGRRTCCFSAHHQPRRGPKPMPKPIGAAA